MADTTKINGVFLSTYGASLLEYNSGAISLDSNYFKADNRLRMTVLPSRLPLRSITLKLEFIGESDNAAETNASKLIQVLSGETELFLPDGFLYRCVLQKTGKPSRKAKGIFQREVSLAGYRHGALETKTVNVSGSSITVKGNYKTEARFTMTATGSTVIVNGITVSNVASGATIVIDGIDCFVKQNGTNKFDDCDLTEFPMLQVGMQAITFSGANSVKVEYYPIFY